MTTLVKNRVVLRFPRTLVNQSIMCRLAREFSLDFNILKASVTPNEEVDSGSKSGMTYHT